MLIGIWFMLTIDARQAGRGAQNSLYCRTGKSPTIGFLPFLTVSHKCGDRFFVCLRAGHQSSIKLGIQRSEDKQHSQGFREHPLVLGDRCDDDCQPLNSLLDLPQAQLWPIQDVGQHLGREIRFAAPDQPRLAVEISSTMPKALSRALMYASLSVLGSR